VHFGLAYELQDVVSATENGLIVAEMVVGAPQSDAPAVTLCSADKRPTRYNGRLAEVDCENE
jgi:hypothetical protein